MSGLQENLDISTIIVSGATNITLSIILTALFCMLRPLKKDVYEPRSLYSEKKLQPIPNGLFSWLPRTFKAKDMEILKTAGLDSLMMIKFVGFGAKMMTIMTIFGLPLMVLHFFAKLIDTGVPIKPGSVLEMRLDYMSMSNVSRGSKLFYVHSALAYLISFIAYYYLYKMWVDYISLRKEYFKSEEFKDSINNRILLFTSIMKPKSFFMEMKKLPFTEPPQQVLSGRDYSKLNQLVERHEELTAEFEKVLVKYLNGGGKVKNERPRHNIDKKFLLLGGTEVDSIEYYSNELKNLERLIYEQRSLPVKAFQLDGSAFVLFNSINACHRSDEKIGNALSRNHLVQIFTARPDHRLSPNMDDLVWENVGNSAMEKRYKKVLAIGFTIALTFGWFLLESLVQSFSAYLTRLGDLAVTTKFRSVVTIGQSIVAPALLAGLNVLLFLLLKIISKMQGVVSRSGVERSALLKYFVFQIYRLIISVSASAVFYFVGRFLSGQSSNADFNELLGGLTTAAIRQSNVFVVYVNSGLTFYGIVIVQAAPFVLKYVKKNWLNSTPRDLFELEAPPKFQYFENYGFLLTTLLIAFAYSLITPMVLPFAAVSFALAYMVLKYQLLFIFETDVESGGIWWPKVFNLICFSIGFFQTMTFGALVVLGARQTGLSQQQAETRIPNLLVTPLPFVTIAFWLYATFYLRTTVERVPEKLAKQIDAAGAIHSPAEGNSLKEKIFNPAIIKVLPKVWVRKEQEESLRQFYCPEFQNLIEYVNRTKAPEVAAHARKQEGLFQLHHRKTLMKRLTMNRRNRNPDVNDSQETEVDLLPPEHM